MSKDFKSLTFCHETLGSSAMQKVKHLYSNNSSPFIKNSFVHSPIATNNNQIRGRESTERSSGAMTGFALGCLNGMLVWWIDGKVLEFGSFRVSVHWDAGGKWI
ncbi:hypothetical protein CFOL_v3_02626 [Cephalotus follicularis]|uniref:Uncharacterized protein n=1 Tax=Cephalotus follicularis TaxID=3775 RepID=A0A1Q3AU60_CEPFO|nr:hypothetical protein CFOL_v3_02626 [Cephalotus follicularis]